MTPEQIAEVQQVVDQIASNTKKEIKNTENPTTETVLDAFAVALNYFTEAMRGSILKEYGLQYIDDETLLNLTVNKMYEHARCCTDCIPPCFYKLVDLNRYIFDPCKDVSDLMVISYSDLEKIFDCAKWWCETKSEVNFPVYSFYRALKILLYGYVEGLYLRDDITPERKREIGEKRLSYIASLNQEETNKKIDYYIDFYKKKLDDINSGKIQTTYDDHQMYIRIYNDLLRMKRDYNDFLIELYKNTR